jgi:thioredoxin
MKKIFLCLMALMMLTACNNNSEQNNKSADIALPTQKTESTNRDSASEQGKWEKQTTIMTNKPMVVDFFATWCGPCRELTPILDKLEKNYKGQVIFKRVDVDQEPDLAQEFHVEAIPLLLFVTPKGEYQSLMGLQEQAVIEAKINDLLNRSAK